VIERTPLPSGNSTVVALPDGIAYLASPYNGIFPARVVFVKLDGTTRSVTVGRIRAGIHWHLVRGVQVGDIRQPGLTVDPAAAIRNLRRMAEFEWSGRYGFFEAVDYAKAGGQVVRSWMAHHQGMSLLAACNLLCNSPMQRYFHSEPHVMATELLLHERVPTGVIAEAEELAAAVPVPA